MRVIMMMVMILFLCIQHIGWIDYKQSTAVFMFEPNAMHFRSLTSILHTNKVPQQLSSIYLSIYQSIYLLI